MSDAVQQRAYQADAHDGAFARWAGGDDATLLVLPTGTGKTVVAGQVARTARDAFDRRTLFLAHREELIHQAADKLSRFDLDCAVEMGAARAKQRPGLFGEPDVVIATVQTMQGARLKTWGRDEFGLVVTDEAHHARARTYGHIYDHFRGAWHLGITATPDRGDKKNLGAVYQSVAFEYSLADAIRDGWLVPLVTARLQTDVNLDDIKTTGGDYNAADLEARIGPHVEALARAVAAEVGGRTAVVFTPDVGSAEAMASALDQLGVPARPVSGRMSRAARRETLRGFAAREFQAVCCCDLLTEGWDEPHVSCVVVCRPTKKRNRYAQMIGRGTRPHPASGKVDCLVIDFAWETTSGHELCTPVDLFDDSGVDDEVMAEAKTMARGEAGARLDPRDLIRQAELVVAGRRTLQCRLVGREPVYRKFVYDPVGVGALVGVRLKEGWDFNPANPATRPQLDYLARLGVDAPGGISKQGAGKLIDRLSDRIDQGLATVRQVKFMEDLGLPHDQAVAVKFADASGVISGLVASRPARRRRA